MLLYSELQYDDHQHRNLDLHVLIHDTLGPLNLATKLVSWADASYLCVKAKLCSVCSDVSGEPSNHTAPRAASWRGGYIRDTTRIT